MKIQNLKENRQNIYLYPLIAAVILRLAAIPFLSTSTAGLMEYGTIARNMLSGAGYAFTWYHADGSFVILPTAYMPPGQVYIQYAAFRLFGNNSAAMLGLYLFQIVQVCTYIYLLGKISGILFKSRKAILTTIWLAAIYPPFIYLTMNFGVTSSALLLNALVLYIGILFSEALRSGEKQIKYALLMGVSCGLMLLFRGEAPITILMTLGLIGYLTKDKLGQSLRYLGLSAMVAIAILAPWTIRNYIVFDRFVPISTNGGFNFWRGNNDVTTGSPWTETGSAVWSTDDIWYEVESHLDEKGDYDKVNSDIHTREAWKWIRENPAKAALLSLKKAAILWTIDMRSIMGGTAAYILIYSFTLAALMIGIFFVRRNKISKTNANAKTGFGMIILWCVLMTMLAMVFFPLPRFQVLLIGIYFPIIGYGITQLIERYKSRRA